MSDFRRYDHVVRLGHQDVEGIDLGRVFVFPKIDGTNASLWADPVIGEGGMEPDFFSIRAGSRNRELRDVAEVPKGEGDVTEFEDLVSIQPGWAPGFPIAAEGFRCVHYRKD